MRNIARVAFFAVVAVSVPHHPSRILAQEAVGARIGVNDLSVLEALSTDAPDNFAGVSVDEDAGRATVYVVGSRRDAALQQVRNKVDARRSQPTDGLAIEYKLVGRSQASLNLIKESVTENRSWITSAGGELRYWGVDSVRNVVQVAVGKVTPQLAAAARKEFGDAVQLVESGPITSFNRFADIPPFWSGSQIHDIDQHFCTAGFAVRNKTTGSKAMLTAGHCFQNFVALFQNTRSIGSTFIVEKTHRGFDRALFRGQTYDAMMWTGPFNSNTAQPVLSTVGLIHGSKACVNGGVNGEHCNCTVIPPGNGGCAIISGGETCNLSALSGCDSTGIPAGVGDSGGPIFRKCTSSGGCINGVQAVGMIIGGNTSGVIFYHNIGNALPSGWEILLAP